MSAPASPSVSRCSTPHNFSNDETEESEDDEVHREVREINNNTLNGSGFKPFIERPKSSENLMNNLNLNNA